MTSIRFYKVDIIDDDTNEIILRFVSLITKKEQESGRLSFKNDVIEALFSSAYIITLYPEGKIIAEKNRQLIIDYVNNNKINISEIKTDRISLKGNRFLSSIFYEKDRL